MQGPDAAMPTLSAATTRVFRSVRRRFASPAAAPQLPHMPNVPGPPTATVYTDVSIALARDFFNREQFIDFWQNDRQFFENEIEAHILRHCASHGIRGFGIGYCPPSEVAVIGPDTREHLMARGLNSRQRAAIDELERFLTEHDLSAADAKIYGHEAITPLALFLRGRFIKFIGTEYASNPQQAEALFPILHGDVCRSEFADHSFHAVISCDVLEHVPDIDMALAETKRILKPGGRFIFTVPFHYMKERSERYASLRAGEIVHHTETPLYHGNPMDPNGGSLVFEVPSWDILDRARRAGFTRAAMRFICDQDRGIVGSSLGEAISAKGVFVGLFDR